MSYLAEFMGCLVFLLGGYGYMCNVTLKKTLIGKLNYVELVIAWSLAVGFGLTVAASMSGPAYLNPGAVIGSVICGSLGIVEACIYILMEFLAAGAAVALCMLFFYDSFKASKEESKKGIFAAYPVEMNIPFNFFQEVAATFIFLFLVFIGIIYAENAIMIGLVGACSVAFLALSFNSTGFSMNAMRSFFSSIWYAILPIPNKGTDKVIWKYQIIVNLVGSTLGGILAVIVTTAIKNSL